MPDSTLEYLQSLRIAALRHDAPHEPRFTDDTWQRLIVWASPKRLLGRDETVRGVGILWDDPRSFGPRERRYDVGIPIDEADVPLVEHPVFVLVTQPGRYLKTTHEGAYETIFDTYARVCDEDLRYGGWRLTAAPIVEIYRNSPAEVPEDELRTDIYFPVIK